MALRRVRTQSPEQPDAEAKDSFRNTHLNIGESLVQPDATPASTGCTVPALTGVLLAVELYCVGSSYSLGVFYDGAGCGLFSCDHWLFASPYHNGECNAKNRVVRLAQFTITATIYFLAVQLWQAVTLGSVAHKYPLITAVLSAITAALAYLWFHLDACGVAWSALDNSRRGSCGPINALVMSVELFVAILLRRGLV